MPVWVASQPWPLNLAICSWQQLPGEQRSSLPATDLGSHPVSPTRCGILGKELGISKFQVSNLGRNTLQYSRAMCLARSAAEQRAGTCDTRSIVPQYPFSLLTSERIPYVSLSTGPPEIKTKFPATTDARCGHATSSTQWSLSGSILWDPEKIPQRKKPCSC